ARFQRWNSPVSSSVCASSIASPLPEAANQRASSDLPERGGPVSTAVRNGQLSGATSASATCALAAPMTIRAGPDEPWTNGRAICVMLPRAAARDGGRVVTLRDLPAPGAQRGRETVDITQVCHAHDRG